MHDEYRFVDDDGLTFYAGEKRTWAACNVGEANKHEKTHCASSGIVLQVGHVYCVI